MLAPRTMVKNYFFSAIFGISSTLKIVFYPPSSKEPASCRKISDSSPVHRVQVEVSATILGTPEAQIDTILWHWWTYPGPGGVAVVVYFILSRLLQQAHSTYVGLLCMPHSGMRPLAASRHEIPSERRMSLLKARRRHERRGGILGYAADILFPLLDDTIDNITLK